MTNVAIDVRLTETSLWQWQIWQGLPYLTCNLLEDWSTAFLPVIITPKPRKLLRLLGGKCTGLSRQTGTWRSPIKSPRNY